MFNIVIRNLLSHKRTTVFDIRCFHHDLALLSHRFSPLLLKERGGRVVAGEGDAKHQVMKKAAMKHDSLLNSRSDFLADIAFCKRNVDGALVRSDEFQEAIRARALYKVSGFGNDEEAEVIEIRSSFHSAEIDHV